MNKTVIDIKQKAIDEWYALDGAIGIDALIESIKSEIYYYIYKHNDEYYNNIRKKLNKGE